MVLAWSIGIAKPTPMLPLWVPAPPEDPSDAIAVLMPTTRPLLSTSAPPEFPGLIAASVWIASVTTVGEEPELPELPELPWPNGELPNGELPKGELPNGEELSWLSLPR